MTKRTSAREKEFINRVACYGLIDHKYWAKHRILPKDGAERILHAIAALMVDMLMQGATVSFGGITIIPEIVTKKKRGKVTFNLQAKVRFAHKYRVLWQKICQETMIIEEREDKNGKVRICARFRTTRKNGKDREREPTMSKLRKGSNRPTSELSDPWLRTIREIVEGRKGIINDKNENENAGEKKNGKIKQNKT